MVLLSSKGRGLADAGQDAAADSADHYQIPPLPCNHIIGRIKQDLMKHQKFQILKAREHEPDQLQQAEQVHLVTLTPVPAVV